MKGGQADWEAGLLCRADCKAVSLGTNTCSSFKIEGRPPGPPGRASRCSAGRWQLHHSPSQQGPGLRMETPLSREGSWVDFILREPAVPVGEGPPRHLLTPPLPTTVREILSYCLALVHPCLGAPGWQVIDAESCRCLDAHSAAFPSLQPMDSPRSASLLCLQPPGGPGEGGESSCLGQQGWQVRGSGEVQPQPLPLAPRNGSCPEVVLPGGGAGLSPSHRACLGQE